MPGKIIKLNGICKDIDRLTGISFHYLPLLKGIDPPLCSKKKICIAKDFKKQRLRCQSREISLIKRFRNPQLKVCRFKCHLTQLMLPVFKKGHLVGVALTDKILQTSRPRLKRYPRQVCLKPAQITSLASILNRCRLQLAESISWHQDSVPNSKDEIFIHRAKDFIEKNYHNSRLPLKDLAREVNTSYYYLCRLFKKELGLSFIQYLTLLRLKAALRLLQNLNLTVAQVSYAAGFSEPQYFDRVFKKTFKCKPKDYRLSSELKREKIRHKVSTLLG